MKISIKQEIWLDVNDLEWLEEYYDTDEWNWKPSAVKGIEERLVQGILDQYLREWDLEALKDEITKYKLSRRDKKIHTFSLD